MHFLSAGGYYNCLSQATHVSSEQFLPFTILHLKLAENTAPLKAETEATGVLMWSCCLLQENLCELETKALLSLVLLHEGLLLSHTTNEGLENRRYIL